MTNKQIIKYCISALVGFFLGILVNIPSCQKNQDIKVEYVKIHDTIVKTEYQIQEKTKIKYIDRIDTFYVTTEGDSIELKDLPIEHKEYNDTILQDSVKATVNVLYSGYNAKIDSFNLYLESYNKNTVITKNKTKRFGWDVTIGPSIGYGVTFGPHGTYQNGFNFGINLVIGPSFRISK